MKKEMDNTHPIDSDLKEIRQETELDKSFKELFSGNNLQQKTQLNSNEIKKLSILWTYAEKYNFVELQSLITEFMKERISLKRKGRGELVESIKSERLHQELLLSEHKGIKER